MQPRNRFSAQVMAAFAAPGLPRMLGLRSATSGEPAEILLYDEIGQWGITSTDFAAALKDAGKGPVRVRINSPGGDVFDGMAIYNMLMAHPGGASTVVDGLAASAASYIALAGSIVTMAETSQMMIHNAWGVTVGNKAEMTKTAGILGRIDGQLVDIYAGKTGKDNPDVAAMMDAETWMTATEAKAQGFCDTVVTPKSKANVDGARTVGLAALRAALRDLLDSDGTAGEAIARLREALNPVAVVEPEPQNDAAKDLRGRRLRFARSQ